MKTNESSMNSNYTTDYSIDAGIDHQLTNGVYENRNVQALTNILTTYALNHKISYWQGMSDLCSPLLLAIQNEADTYICFAALMRRLSANFNGDECMANKFDLLRKLVQHYDPEFYDYLVQHQASDLLFCYRWLLLELKREFKLDNALYMLEVSWAAMPPQFYHDLPMYNAKFVPTIDESINKITVQMSADETTIKTKNNDSNDEMMKKNDRKPMKSSPKSVNNSQTKKSSIQSANELDASSMNSSKTLSNSLSFKSFKTTTNHSIQQHHHHHNQQHVIFGTKLIDNHNIKNLKTEMTNVATDLGRDLSKQLSNGVNQLKRSVNEVANAASELYANLNNQQSSTATMDTKTSIRSTLKGLKLSSVEDQLAFKREKFHQQNTTGHSVCSLNEMRFSLDRDQEGGFNDGNQRKSKNSKNSSLNGSNHSLVECNSKLNSILNKTQAMFKEQTINKFNFNLMGRKESKSCLTLFKDNKDSPTTKCTATKQYRHIRFLPKILSTDSNDNTIDSPDADDLNDKCGGQFPHLINKQFSIDSVDSLEFNYNPTDSFTMNPNRNSISSSNRQSSFNNNFTCFSTFNNLPSTSFINSLPFTKQNSIPNQTTNLLKQQLKQSLNQQNHQHLHHQQHHYLKQRSLPSSPLFKKKLDSFERPFLPFLQNVTNIFDRQMFVAEQQSNYSSTSSSYNTVYNNNNAQKFSSINPTTNSTNTINSSINRNELTSSKRSKLISNQFGDSFDQRDLFVHCNGENETSNNNSTSVYNSNWNNWKPERGLLNCFNGASFDASPPFQTTTQTTTSITQSTNFNSSTASHQRLARQLSDKLINEKMIHNNNNNCNTTNLNQTIGSCYENDEQSKDTKKQQIIKGQLVRLNLNNNQTLNQSHQLVANEQSIDKDQYLKTNSNSTNSSTTTYEKEEKSEGYCSGNIFKKANLFVRNDRKVCI